ncbi:hypothetical protein L211DRAFT_835745 [Terfezia boudieri ATCC MYA-4762]|uniref:Uncharacterized protein n=1 Tax=Terfezia boudieri ATCC MYA-4762 TaxID=1051890 RepID=A0A3N4LXR6_9PEZI|nr:hypothetical protein L211DRAFT_835745 [Terfezia boudieri ATCC MYA-4762]
MGLGKFSPFFVFLLMCSIDSGVWGKVIMMIMMMMIVVVVQGTADLWRRGSRTYDTGKVG